MSGKTIKIPKKLARSFSISADRMDEESRTVELSFSSDLPYPRYFGNEILDHGDGCDLSRMNDGGALLWNHNWDDQIGVVESARIDGNKGYAKVRFSKNPRGQEMWQDVKDGIRRNVSVGYEINEMVLETERGDEPSDYRVTRWEPLEISLVSVPADPSVGVGRAAEDNSGMKEITVATRGMDSDNDQEKDFSADSNKPQIEEERKNLEVGDIEPTETISQRVEVMPEQNELMTAERQRVSDIHKLASNPKYAAKCDGSRVQGWIDNGTSIEQVTRDLLDSMGAVEAPPAPGLGLSEKEQKSYSLVRAISSMAKHGKLDGFEKELSEETAKRIGRDPQGFYIPGEIRALTANTSTAGGFTVDTDLQGGNLIELLRNKTKVAQLGARSISGLVGDVAIPKHTGGATAYWLGETETATDSQQTFGQITMTPHRLVGTTPLSKQLLAQSSIDVEGFVRDDIARVLAIAKDLACINGLGADGEPRGILNTTGINTVTFGGAPTWADVVDFETQISSDNADVENMSFLTTASTRGKWKTTVKVANEAIYLLEDNMANGYRFEVSEQVPSNRVIFGNWNDLIMADWEGMDVVVDPYTLAKSNQIQITITLMSDVAVRHPVSFCASTDAGNQ